jgi:hypothetical protein
VLLCVVWLECALFGRPRSDMYVTFQIGSCAYSLFFLKVFPQPRSLQGKTALLQAVGHRNVATVQVLVAAKANLEAKTRNVGLFFPY